MAKKQIEVPDEAKAVLNAMKVPQKRFLEVQKEGNGFAICTKDGTILIDENYCHPTWAPITAGPTPGSNPVGHKLPASGGSKR